MIEKLMGIIEDQSNIINRLTSIVEKLTGTNNTQQPVSEEYNPEPLKQGKLSFNSVRGNLERLHSNDYIRKHHPEQTEEYWKKRAYEESIGIDRTNERDHADSEGIGG
jgi:hypothetical protein